MEAAAERRERLKALRAAKEGQGEVEQSNKRKPEASDDEEECVFFISPHVFSIVSKNYPPESFRL